MERRYLLFYFFLAPSTPTVFVYQSSPHCEYISVVGDLNRPKMCFLNVTIEIVIFCYVLGNLFYRKSNF